MQIVISVSEDTYRRHKWRVNHDACTELDIALAKGTPLPKGHGRLFDEKDIVNGDYKIIGNKIYELEPIIEADRESDSE